MSRCRIIKVVFIFVASILLFPLYGMENDQDQQNINPPKYTIFFNIILKMSCDNKNQDVITYFQKYNDEDIRFKEHFINEIPCWNCVKMPFIDSDINDFFGAELMEYLFKTEEVPNPYDSGRYCMQLSCSGKVCIKSFYDNFCYIMNDKYLSFLELAIIAALKEHRIDSDFNAIQSTYLYFLADQNNQNVPSSQDTLEKAIQNELTFDPKVPIITRPNEYTLLLKRHFPTLLLPCMQKRGKDLSDEISKNAKTAILCEKYDFFIY